MTALGRKQGSVSVTPISLTVVTIHVEDEPDVGVRAVLLVEALTKVLSGGTRLIETKMINVRKGCMEIVVEGFLSCPPTSGKVSIDYQPVGKPSL